MKIDRKDIQGKLDAIREGISRALATIDDGKAHRRQHKGISFSRDLSAQYRKMSELAESADSRYVMPIMMSLVRDGELSDGREVLKFSPTTIQYLKHLLETTEGKGNGVNKT